MVAAQSLPDEPALPPEIKAAYLCLIEEHAGLRLSEHQAQCLDEAVGALLTRGGYASPIELYRALAAGAGHDLLNLLVAAVTVGETHFFRIGPQIAALRRTVLPELVTRRSAERRLGIWSAGCSTGEEAYTLAILLREALPANEEWDRTILATDISRRALDTARQAIYGEWSFRDTPQAVRRRYFTAIDARWQLVEPVRRMVRFAELTWRRTHSPRPGQMDLIST